LNISGASGCGLPEKLVALLGISDVGGNAEVWRGLIVFRMAVSPSSSVGEPCGNSAVFSSGCPMPFRCDVISKSHHFA
jgi:hypothetical protein